MKQRKPLNPKQTAILELMCEGYTSREIAEKLTITANAVRGRLVAVYNKLGAKNSNHAVALYLINKLLFNGKQFQPLALDEAYLISLNRNNSKVITNETSIYLIGDK